MNESVTDMSWNYDGTYVRYASDQDNTEWHTEAYNQCGLSQAGWNPDSYSAYFDDNAGGTYSHLEVQSYFGYSYAGKFDCGGTKFYNQFWNWLAGYANGSATCAIQYSYRNTFAGWYDDYWCDWGNYEDDSYYHLNQGY